jgi:hypothetical protein
MGGGADLAEAPAAIVGGATHKKRKSKGRKSVARKATGVRHKGPRGGTYVMKGHRRQYL